jgi:hypothetical protein
MQIDLENLDRNPQTYFDMNPKSIEAIVASIPKVVSWLKKTNGDDLGTTQMFYVDYDDADDAEGDIDRNYPCCTMGHVFYEAGLQDSIGIIENDESPANFFTNPTIRSKVQKIATANDETGNPDRIPEVIKGLEALRAELVRIKK